MGQEARDLVNAYTLCLRNLLVYRLVCSISNTLRATFLLNNSILVYAVAVFP